MVRNKLKPNSLDILIHFRLNKIDIYSDIKQAFLKICSLMNSKTLFDFFGVMKNHVFKRSLNYKFTVSIE